MATDWKDALSSLLGNSELPAEPENETGNPAENSASSTDAPKGKRTLKLFYEKKGRGGKPATIIEGFDPEGNEDEECAELAGKLKKKLGRGGSARGGEILIQGDCREQLRKLLKEMGYTVKG